MEVGDEVVDLTGLDEELKRSGDSSASGGEGKKSHKIIDSARRMTRKPKFKNCRCIISCNYYLRATDF